MTSHPDASADERGAAGGPAVTVVIPMHDGGRFIGATLRSVLAQTYDGFEVIVVDDGSTDDGPGVVRSFDDPRIRLISTPHLGVAAARNAGAAHASAGTRHLAFLDADDLWSAELLAELVATLDQRPDAAGAFALADYIDADGAPLLTGDFPRHMRHRDELVGVRLVRRDPTADLRYEHLFLANPVYPPSCMIVRRDRYEEVGGFDGRFLAEDWEFVTRLARTGALVPVDRVMVGYRRHGANASGDRPRNVRGARQVWAAVYHDPGNDAETRSRLRAVWRAHQRRTAARKFRQSRALLRDGAVLTAVRRASDAAAHLLLPHPPRLWMTTRTRPGARERPTVEIRPTARAS